MRYATYFFAYSILALCAIPGWAQEGPGNFDPVIYLKTFKMGDQYTNGKFIDPPYVETTFENYMIDRADILAFTIRHQSKDSAGWTLWMDFEIQRFGQKRLTRVFAQKEISGKLQDVFKKQADWIGQLLEDKLCGDLESKTNFRTWEYEDGTAVFTLKVTPPQEDGNTYLTFDIRQVTD